MRFHCGVRVGVGVVELHGYKSLAELIAQEVEALLGDISVTFEPQADDLELAAGASALDRFEVGNADVDRRSMPGGDAEGERRLGQPPSHHARKPRLKPTAPPPRPGARHIAGAQPRRGRAPTPPLARSCRWPTPRTRG